MAALPTPLALNRLYEPTDNRRIYVLGDQYRPPQTFRHGAWELVADLEAVGDGQGVKVFESRMPARFFKIEVAAGAGATQRPFAFSTGSGNAMGELIGEMAKAIAGGMLGVEPPAAPGQDEDRT